MHQRIRAILIAFCFALCAVAQAQQDGPLNFRIPDDVSTRAVDIWSEGTRMSGTVFKAKSAPAAAPMPTILMAHGWGGSAAALTRDAVAFAQEGYLVVTFDYRGWGRSDSRVILTKPAPAEKKDGRFVAEVREVREVVDPIDMLADWQAALHWLHGEPEVDKSRIGIWGSSQSGGYVAEMATRDPRIKAVYSQVGAFNGHGFATTPEAYADATKRARGEVGYPEPGIRVVGNLRGAPIYSRFANYAPVDHINDAGQIPMMIVVAENEELFDNKQHGILAYERYKGPKELVVVPGIKHYGIYRESWSQAHKLAREWFDKQLKAK